MDCERNPVFKLAEYSLPKVIQNLFRLVGNVLFKLLLIHVHKIVVLFTDLCKI